MTNQRVSESSQSSKGKMRRQSKSPARVDRAAVEKLKAELAADRENIVLHRRPIQTLRLFFSAAAEFVVDTVSYLSTHPFMLRILPALVLVYLGLRALGLADGIEKAIAFVIWWLGLGVLSSIGLGTGLHTGMLFLFPHIFKVVQAADACHSMAFDSYQDIWYKQDVVMCVTQPVDGSSPPSFFQVALRSWIPAVIWGAGTAMGEVPPYLMSRAAMLAGGALEDEVKEELNIDSSNPIGMMKQWMIKFVEKYGFWGVFLMSAWPNAAFDLVGIVCGQIGVTFWTFFLATFCGKALVKVTGQVIFFVSIFRHTHQVIEFIVWLIEKLPAGIIKRLPKEEEIKHKLENLVAKLSSGNAEPETEAGWLKWGFDKVVLLIIVSFAISCVNQFAQKKQKDLDTAFLGKASSRAAASSSKAEEKKPRKKATSPSVGKSPKSTKRGANGRSRSGSKVKSVAE